MKLRTDNTILLSSEEVRKLCRPGEGADTCIWVLAGPDGLECSYYNRPTALNKRWTQGLTVAKRDGCAVVKSLNLKIHFQEAVTLEDVIHSQKNV